MDEALIVKVRGVLGADEGDSNEITLLSHIVRYGQTTIGWPWVEWEEDPRQVEIITETPGLGRAEATQMRINSLAQDRLDFLFKANQMARWMSQPNSLAWEVGKRRGRYLLGKPRMVQRFVTQLLVETRCRPFGVLADAKVRNRLCSLSRKTCP